MGDLNSTVRVLSPCVRDLGLQAWDFGTLVEDLNMSAKDLGLSLRDPSSTALGLEPRCREPQLRHNRLDLNL